MALLPISLQSWNTDSFSHNLKNEIESLSSGLLPLEKGTTQGGMIDDGHITVTVLTFSEGENSIQAKLGVFFTEIVICCGCGDDPMETNAYCEMLATIDKITAETAFVILNEAA